MTHSQHDKRTIERDNDTMNNVTRIEDHKMQQQPQQIEKKMTVFKALEGMRGDLERALPRHLTAERLLQLSYTSIRKNPELLECTPASLVGAIMQAATLGLEPDVLGTCYLIPYNRKVKNNGRDEWIKEVQLQIGYKGLIELVRRTGHVTSIVANEVYSKDYFEFEYGLHEKLKHVPAMHTERGEIIAFYAYARFKDGGHAFIVMSIADIMKVRNKYAKVNRSTGEVYGTWADHFESMAKKTVIKQLVKYMPISVEVQDSIANDGVIKPSIDDDPIDIPLLD